MSQRGPSPSYSPNWNKYRESSQGVLRTSQSDWQLWNLKGRPTTSASSVQGTFLGANLAARNLKQQLPCSVAGSSKKLKSWSTCSDKGEHNANEGGSRDLPSGIPQHDQRGGGRQQAALKNQAKHQNLQCRAYD